jgi:elongation factor Ts
VDQPYVKNDKLTIQEYTEQTAKQLGGTIKIVDFVRFEKGEGLEKRQDNFADEVAGMVK